MFFFLFVIAAFDIKVLGVNEEKNDYLEDIDCFAISIMFLFPDFEKNHLSQISIDIHCLFIWLFVLFVPLENLELI